MSEYTKVIINARTGAKQTVEMTPEEKSRRQFEEAQWELKRNTRANKNADDATVEEAKRIVLEDLIKSEALKPLAPQVVKDAAQIIRSRGS